jgi:signal transduction histidine kinase
MSVVCEPHGSGLPACRDRKCARPDGEVALELLKAQHRQLVAEQMLRRQTESLALAVHELRGPLGPMQNVSALLAKGGGAIELDKLASLLDRQVRTMARLIDDLLDVSRVATGKLHLRRTRIDLARLLAHTVEAWLPSMSARAQHFTAFIPSGPLMVDADEVRLMQVFMNLLQNASKYTPQMGAISLTCAVEAGAGMPGTVVVTVADNGVGITSTALSRIFEPFVQDQHAVQFAADGLGIGLTLVRELVQAHGGKVAAVSPGPGFGSQFVVRLPLLEKTQSEFLANGPANRSAHGKRESVNFSLGS